jgi:hypothetical protein
MTRSGGRGAALLLSSLAVLGLSFWASLTLIDTSRESGDVRLADVPLLNEDGTPRSTRSSIVLDLPPPASGSSFSVAWDGIDGLNALVLGPAPAGGKQLALSLVATRDTGRHRLGLQLVRLPTNRPIRMVAWIKVAAGTHIGVDARDGKPQGSQNFGSAMFETSPPAVIVATGNARAAIESGPEGWVKIPVEMQTADGVIVIYFGLLGPGNSPAFSGIGEHLIYGGIEVTPG